MYNELTLEDKKQLYDRTFSIGNFNTKKLNDRLVLISLVSLAYNKLKQNPRTETKNRQGFCFCSSIRNIFLRVKIQCLFY